MINRFKFRAWDKQDKIMYDWEEISIEKEQVFIRDGDLYKTFEQIELMQFTVFLDKNGKEIYEGDIVKSILGQVFFINFDYGSFGAQHINTNTRYSSATFSFHEKKFEIIGNIYENPELLK